MLVRFICFICFLSVAACSSHSPRQENAAPQGGVTESQTPITQQATRAVGDVIIIEMDEAALKVIGTKIQKLFSKQNQPQIKLNLAENTLKTSSRAPASVGTSAPIRVAPVHIDLAGVASMPFQVREVLPDGTMRLQSRHPLRVARKLCEVEITAELSKNTLGVGNTLPSSALTTPQYKVVFDSVIR